MRIVITGICGFVGSRVALHVRDSFADAEVSGIDNLLRRGSETNLAPLKAAGCRVLHGDVRVPDDVSELPRCDWIVDCAANPSVLAGIQGGTNQLVGHNLVGTLNLLEKCRRDGAGFLILSTSRVYSIAALNAIPLIPVGRRYAVDTSRALPSGATGAGVDESFSTAAPVSLYGATKLASEVMALEYGAAFGLPVWVDRCGVIAGPGQFGRIDQGVFSFWIYQWLQRKPLTYIGYGGRGLQVRDLISPRDLCRLLESQLRSPSANAPRVVNVGGGPERSMSLCELSNFCLEALGPGPDVGVEPETRRYDVPYYVSDARVAQEVWNWKPSETREQTLESIARWASDNLSLVERFGTL